MNSPETDAADLLTALGGTALIGAPDGVWSAPGRVNLIGEHTDYNEGFVLPFAIDRRTAVAVRRRADHRIRVVSTLDPVPVEVPLTELPNLFPGADTRIPRWSAYPLGVAWATLAAAGTTAITELPGLDLAFASDVPVGAGLSSSAAIEGATALALNDLWDLELDRETLARVGRRAENEAVGAPTGIMDQMAAMLGERDAAVFLDCRSLTAELVPLGFADAGLEVVVIDTRVTHAHATGGYRDRREACERGAAALGVPALRDLMITDLATIEDAADAVLDDVTLRRVRHIVTENQRVLDTVRALRTRGPRAVGAYLTASHASMRDDFEISVPELDTAVASALAAGALGARMTGGGFGGAAIALVDRHLVPTVHEAVDAAFAAAGHAQPHVFTVHPADGAHRDR